MRSDAHKRWKSWRRRVTIQLALTSLLLLRTAAAAEPQSSARGNSGREDMVTYKTVQVHGLSVFYREAGDPKNPTILLLHGFPSSSRMYDRLRAKLAPKYHLVAPDYPGFGHSDAPDPGKFDYTFDHVADVVDESQVLWELGITHSTCRITAVRWASGWHCVILSASPR